MNGQNSKKDLRGNDKGLKSLIVGNMLLGGQKVSTMQLKKE